MRSFTLTVLVVASVVVLAGGLSWAQRQDPPARQDAAAEKPLTEQEADQQELVASNNQFACDVYAQLKDKPGNLFFAPGSLATALTMTSAGTNSETNRQMLSTLRHTLPEDRLHPAFAQLQKHLQREDAGIQLHVANRLWGQQGMTFLPTFLNTMQTSYGAELGQVDFLGDADAARLEINQWVEEQTSNKIKDLIPAGAVGEDTAMVLTNAVYFQGNWKKPFALPKEPAPFHVSQTEEKNVPTMHVVAAMGYRKLADLELIAIPYEEQQYSLLVLMPGEVNGLAALEAQLSAEQLQEWTAGMKTARLGLFMPKFNVASQVPMKPVLQALGMTDAFSRQADFSRLSTAANLFLSDVVHQSFVSVDEKGTLATGATGTIVTLTSRPQFVHVDRPFLFLVRDDATGCILFMGRVVDPS